MKATVILCIVVTVGITFPIAFFSGTILTRPARDELSKQKENYEKELSSANDSLMKKQKEIYSLTSLNEKSTALLIESSVLLKKTEEKLTDLLTPPDYLPEKKFETHGYEMTIKNVYLKNEDSGCYIQGEIENSGKFRLGDGYFDISLYGITGEVLDVVNFSISHLKPGMKRAWSVTSYAVKGKVIKNIEIDLVSYIPISSGQFIYP